eukprot:26327-Pleurochrysis_carterae.AAC.1
MRYLWMVFIHGWKARGDGLRRWLELMARGDGSRQRLKAVAQDKGSLPLPPPLSSSPYSCGSLAHPLRLSLAPSRSRLHTLFAHGPTIAHSLEFCLMHSLLRTKLLLGAHSSCSLALVLIPELLLAACFLAAWHALVSKYHTPAPYCRASPLGAASGRGDYGRTYISTGVVRELPTPETASYSQMTARTVRVSVKALSVGGHLGALGVSTTYTTSKQNATMRKQKWHAKPNKSRFRTRIFNR